MKSFREMSMEEVQVVEESFELVAGVDVSKELVFERLVHEVGSPATR